MEYSLSVCIKHCATFRLLAFVSGRSETTSSLPCGLGRKWNILELDAGQVRNHLEDVVAKQGFNGWMAPRILKAEAHELCLEVTVREEMVQHHGFVHGGCISAFADTSAAWAGALACGRDVVTANYSIHFVAPAKGTLLRSVARPVNVGRSSIAVNVNVYSISDDTEEKLCATALASIAALGRMKPD